MSLRKEIVDLHDKYQGKNNGDKNQKSITLPVQDDHNLYRGPDKYPLVVLEDLPYAFRNAQLNQKN